MYRIFFLHSSVDGTQVASMSWLLWPVLLWILGCMDLYFKKMCALAKWWTTHINSLKCVILAFLLLVPTFSPSTDAAAHCYIVFHDVESRLLRCSLSQLGQPAGVQVMSQWLASNCLLETTVRFSLQYKYSQEQYTPLISAFNVTCGLTWHGMPVVSGELRVLTVGTFVPECWLMLRK